MDESETRPVGERLTGTWLAEGERGEGFGWREKVIILYKWLAQLVAEWLRK